MFSTGKKFHKPLNRKPISEDQQRENDRRIDAAMEMIECAVYPPTEFPYRAYQIIDGKRRLLGCHKTLEEAVIIIELLDIAFHNIQDDMLGIPRLYESVSHRPSHVWSDAVEIDHVGN